MNSLRCMPSRSVTLECDVNRASHSVPLSSHAGDVSFPAMSEPIWATRAKKRMRELGLRQIDLLDALGVTSRGAVGNYLSGRRKPSVEQARALAKALNIPFDELFSDEPDATFVDASDRPVIVEMKSERARQVPMDRARVEHLELDDDEMELAAEAIRLVGEVYKELGAPVDVARFTDHVLEVYRAMHRGQHVTRHKVVRLVRSEG